MNLVTFHMISLGCAKNTVDSHSMAQILMNAGYKPSEKPEDANIIIVNTCGFISPAIEESLRELNHLAAHKAKGQILIAAGCLTERFGTDVTLKAKGIDGLLGTRRWMDILKVVEDLRSGKQSKPIYHLPTIPAISRDERGMHRIAVQGGSAYLKIADGCRHRCAFCTIPTIKGPAVSRPIEAIIKDARHLRDSGILELILIAQDTTDYGHDLGIQDGLVQLLEQISNAVPDIPWVRFLYTYPGLITDRLIEFMATHTQIVPYLDMPLQHSHPSTLHRMRRPTNIDWVSRTVEKMRQAIPNLSLRTTFIVGYPGETDEEFQTLLDFMDEIRFDRVGAFQFSLEPGTASAALGDTIPEELKQERYNHLMEHQQLISMYKNLEFVGKTLDVLFEGFGDGISVGRSYRDAPEIDGLVIVQESLPIGKMQRVRITEATSYDLLGVAESTPNPPPQHRTTELF
jgi:ribosomal protein S12 methylthiotransferase